nr:MAG TPA: hypothetical protein [Caudoviricetes sp.]
MTGLQLRPRLDTNQYFLQQVQKVPKEIRS